MEHSNSLQTCPRQSTRLSLLGGYSGMEQLDHIGQLVGALVELTLELGQLSFRAGQEDHKSLIRLSDICQLHFLSEHRSILQRYGWDVDRSFLAHQEKIVKLIQSSISNMNSRKVLDNSKKGLGEQYPPSIMPLLLVTLRGSWLDPDPKAHHDSGLEEIIHHAIFLTAEVIFSSCYTRVPNLRPRWLSDVNKIRSASDILDKLILGGRYPPVPALTLSSFLTDAFRNALPWSRQVHERHLACCSNGYVVYYSALEWPTMNRREVCGITIAPGSLRCGTAMTPFQALEEYEHLAENNGPHIASVYSPLMPFADDRYIGLEPPNDPDSYRIESTVTAWTNTLLSATYYCSQKRGRLPLRILWSHCIESIASSPRIAGPSPSARAETAMAIDMQRQGVFQRTLAISLDVNRQTAYEGMITCTSNDDIARFFAAGRYYLAGNTLVIREDATLIQCITKCLQLVSEPSNTTSKCWIIIA